MSEDQQQPFVAEVRAEKRFGPHYLKTVTYQGTPHGSWRSKEFPYQILFHHPGSGRLGNL